jgi:hypothetical protein
MKYVLIKSYRNGIADTIECVTPMPEALASFLEDTAWFSFFGGDYVFKALAEWISANPHLVNVTLRDHEGRAYLGYDSALLIEVVTVDEARAARDAAMARYEIGENQ